MHSLGSSLKKRDQFGEQFRMKLDDGDDSLQSYMGLICSIILTLVILAYGY